MKRLSILHLLALALVLSLTLAACVTGGESTAATAPSTSLGSTATAPSQTESTAPSVPATTRPPIADVTEPSIPDPTDSTAPTGEPTTEPSIPETTPPTVTPSVPPSIPVSTTPTAMPSVPGSTAATAPTAAPTIPSASPEPSVPDTTVSTAPSASGEPSVPDTTVSTAPSVPSPGFVPQGLTLLEAQDNGKVLVAAYERLAEGVEKAENFINFRDIGLTLEDLDLLVLCYYQDHPHHFWWSGGYRYSFSNGLVVSITPDYTLTGNNLAVARQAFEERVQEYLSFLKPGMTDYEKELKLHDLLVNNCSYVLDAPNAHTAYGAIVEGQAVCSGYSQAFQYLLHRAGISCITVDGTSDGEAHQWNAVYLEGNWYYVDITWDDPLVSEGEPAQVLHAYLNLTLETMNEDHVPYEGILWLPEADCLDYNYYYVKDRYTTEFNVEQLAQWFKESDSVELYFTGDAAAYCAQFEAHIHEILEKAGITDATSYSYSYGNHDLALYLYRD